MRDEEECCTAAATIAKLRRNAAIKAFRAWAREARDGADRQERVANESVVPTADRPTGRARKEPSTDRGNA